MTEEERKLMISMGKAIEGLQKEIVELKKNNSHTIIPPTPAISQSYPYNVDLTENSPKQKITSQIQHTEGNKFFKMDVKIDGMSDLPFEERQKISEQFLRDLESLFEEYKVIKLEGKYNAGNF